MKIIIFFDEYTLPEAGIATLTQKPEFLPKNLTAFPIPGETLRNFWKSYFACKYGRGRSTLRVTKNPDSLKSSLELLGNQGLKEPITDLKPKSKKSANSENSRKN